MSTVFMKIPIWMLFFNYYVINIFFGFQIPYVTYICLAFGLLILLQNSQGQVFFPMDTKYWAAYVILSLITTILVDYKSVAFKGLIEFCAEIVLLLLILKICEIERSIRFPVVLFVSMAALSAIGILSNIGDLSRRLSITTGATFSVNDMGAIMALSCFMIQLIPNKLKRPIITTLKAALTVVLLVVIALSGSRKSFYSIIIMFGLYFILPKKNKAMSSTGFFSLLLAFIILVVAAYKFLPYFDQTSLYSRLFGSRAERAQESDQSRIELYKMAWSCFCQSPLWGIGFNGFCSKYYVYTHSTYAEPIACTGLLGLLYLAPLFNCLKRQFRINRYYKASGVDNSTALKILILFIGFLLIGVGVPYIYKTYSVIVLGLVMSYQMLVYNNMCDGLNVM